VLGGQDAPDAFKHLFAVPRALGPLLLLAHQALSEVPVGSDDLGVDGRRGTPAPGRDDGAQVGQQRVVGIADNRGRDERIAHCSPTPDGDAHKDGVKYVPNDHPWNNARTCASSSVSRARA